jgi:hypothetical protein
MLRLGLKLAMALSLEFLAVTMLQVLGFGLLQS